MSISNQWSDGKIMMLFITIFLALGFSANSQDLPLSENETLAVKLAQQQLEAYNSRNIIQFLEPYADNIRAYNYPDALIFEGKEKMREVYGKLFANSPELHCELVHRTVLGNVVIDQERVTGVAGTGDKVVMALAIYTIRDGKIAEVRFVKRE